MVHALGEVHRALAPDGILIDLRTLTGDWPVEVASSRGAVQAGHPSDLPGREDDKFADEAVARAEALKWFAREREEFFPFYYYWDSPNEMKEYIDEDWQDFVTLDEAAWKDIRSKWAVADADARLRIRVRMLITRWRKQK